MEKFREIIKGEQPIDYGAEKSKWKQKDIKEAPVTKIINKKIGDNIFRDREVNENIFDYAAAKNDWKLKNK